MQIGGHTQAQLPDEVAALEARCARLEGDCARLLSILQEAPEAIWSCDADGIIVTWNRQAERLFGYPAGEILGKSLFALVPQELSDSAREAMSTMARGVAPSRFETVGIRKDGTRVDVELTVAPIWNADGRVAGASTYCRDITGRKESDAATARRLIELATLTQLTEQLQVATQPDEIYRAALQAISDALNCERASILLFDSSRKMRFVAWSGLSETYRKAVDGHSPWTAEAQNPEAIFVDDIGASNEPEELKATIQREGIRSLAFIPLTANGKLIGKFMTYRSAPHRFSEHEKVLANTIARQLALTVSRHLYEEELRASEQRFRLMSEHAPVMIWMSDAQGRCLHLNRMLRTFWGVEDTGIAEFDWSRTIHPEDAGKIYEIMSLAHGDQKGVTLKGRYANALGQYRILQTDARPRRSATGEFLGMIGVNVDITEREESEKALRESEQRFRNAIEAAPSGMIMTDGHGRIVLSNAYAEKLFGYTREEMAGQEIEMLVPDRLRGQHPGHRRGYHEHPRSRMMGLGRELFARRKDGTEIPVEIGLSPFETSEGRMALAAVVDISDRKKAEAHREMLIAELNHRVKNTLATVQSLAQQTFKSNTDRTSVAAFEARLLALSAAHDVLTREKWQGAGLREIIEQVTFPYREPSDGRFRLQGPDVRLVPKCALAVAMGLHELCTNAAKYGALSTLGGFVRMEWSVDRSAMPARLQLQWQERGGPVVRKPLRKGFGSLLVEELLPSDLDGTVVLSHPPEGVTCSIVAPLREPGAALTEMSNA